MKTKSIARRDALNRGLAVSAGGFALVSLSACGEGEQKVVCAGPNNLTFAENSLRQASHYVEKSPHADKDCLKCGFYTAGEGGNVCGKCEIFIGPVNQAGYCDSFAVKQA
ncbi:MAG: hypothetical protein FJX59_18400 [Alphaproteobacteria bacterium]|nr:hypothetical protein [Alphaproteobacteria bacterium]